MAFEDIIRKFKLKEYGKTIIYKIIMLPDIKIHNSVYCYSLVVKKAWNKEQNTLKIYKAGLTKNFSPHQHTKSKKRDYSSKSSFV